MDKACFLDRDGVLIVEKNYLNDIGEVELEQGAAEAVRLLNRHGFKVVVVSNQSGVARGYFTESKVQEINRHIHDQLAAEGAVIDGWYYCPHYAKGTVAEYAVKCDCRKPEPGLLLRAAEELDLDLTQSYMIGDKVSDVDVANRAGCRNGILVRTGHAEEINPEKLATLKYVAANILDAVKLILTPA